MSYAIAALTLPVMTAGCPACWTANLFALGVIVVDESAQKGEMTQLGI